MSLSLEVVQSLAPDQGALGSAGKLLAAKHWIRVARDAATDTIWGECQGSGANPYLVVADTRDHGYKCSCPSRKFPCKHSLALMWRYAERPQEFADDAPPQWVQDWLGRRKRGAKPGTPGAAEGVPAKDIGEARDAAAEAPAPSVEDLQKKARAAERRRAQTEDAVRAGLDDLAQWLRDLLRGGLAAFVEDAPTHCRRIAARLVDAKAAALASRIDELPSRLLALPKAVRAEAAAFELGQCVLLAAAWRQTPDDADARAGVLQSPSRDEVLEAGQGLRVASRWEVAGTRIATRRDGLVSQATWLVDLAAAPAADGQLSASSAGCGFALLLDYVPATAGRRSAAFVPGQRFDAELVFYPGRHPLRAVLHRSLDTPAARPPPLPGGPASQSDAAADPLAAHRRHLSALPWAQLTPLRLGPGALSRDGRGQLWWTIRPGVDGHASAQAASALRVAALADEALWLGAPLTGAIALWDGFQADLLRLDTPLGAAWPDD